MQLQLLLLLSLSLSLSLALPRPPSRNIIKVRASGFLPFESDLLLPLGILRQLQAQDRASRLLPPHPPRRRVKAKPKPKPKQQVRLERAHAQNGMQLYNLIDDDGELLLNLRVHTENGNGNGNGGSKQNSLNTLEEEQQQETPWRPSKWRPTSAPPLLLQTSSSPRPLPLHQYLESNSLEQHQSQTPSTQQRRMFGLRADWNYK